MTFNLATILTETALAAPDVPAYRFMGTATTYGDLDEQSGRFAAGLREAGLETGDVVALQLPNVPHFLTAYFGALKAGMVVLPLNPLLMAPELEYHLGDSSAKLLIGFEGMHAEASKACERLGIPLYLVSFGAAPLPDDARPVSALMASSDGSRDGEVVPRDPGDTAVLIYTSGTTGKP
ncbi:MAG TPA: AMP-binding protein, partial [Streptosporangiaceae bacterium]|nr:AMP-binding protein [Streptosporangiaceae bacterium]